MRPQNRHSLRALGGEGKRFTIAYDASHPQLATECEAVLESTPKMVAGVLLDETHRWHSALEFLIRGEHLTSRQYSLLAYAIRGVAETTTVPKSSLINTVIARTSVNIQVQLHELFGWNQRGDDESGPVNIVG